MGLKDKLLATIEKYANRLEALSDAHAARKPAPEKWSAKEILGHLIDSACNNHRRFVIAHEMDKLVFDGYDQEHWVAVQHYQSASWQDLVKLWRLYNEHIARIVDLIPSDSMEKKHHSHNMHQVAWKTIPQNEPVTLHYFIDDYVNHMEHHLKQIIALTP